jgi:hypothetical protein
MAFVFPGVPQQLTLASNRHTEYSDISVGWQRQVSRAGVAVAIDMQEAFPETPLSQGSSSPIHTWPASVCESVEMGGVVTENDTNKSQDECHIASCSSARKSLIVLESQSLPSFSQLQ